MTPEHVAGCPGTSAWNGVRRVRSSWRRGTKKSASSTVRRPLRSRPACLHSLAQGRQGHKGHLSTSGRGQCPLTDDNWWEAATPHRDTTSLLLLLLCLLLHRASHLLPSRDSPPPLVPICSSSSSLSSSPNHLLPSSLSSPWPRAEDARPAPALGARSA